jgi:hypothetical protein
MDDVTKWTDEQLRQCLDGHMEPAPPLIHTVLAEMMRRYRSRVVNGIRNRLLDQAEELRQNTYSEDEYGNRSAVGGADADLVDYYEGGADALEEIAVALETSEVTA